MGTVVDLARHRRRRHGLRPELQLIGLRSSARVVVKAALAASDEPERLYASLATGTYGDMIRTLVTQFEIKEKDRSQAISL